MSAKNKLHMILHFLFYDCLSSQLFLDYRNIRMEHHVHISLAIASIWPGAKRCIRQLETFTRSTFIEIICELLNRRYYYILQGNNSTCDIKYLFEINHGL